MATEQYGNNYQAVWSNGVWVVTTVDSDGDVAANDYWEFDDEFAAASDWTGIINGVTNPAKVNGVAVANIAAINGVT